ncbi:uncharacterized protein LOC129924077 [Biomphalaria glabrata]|uniref:Uncharacterized protein LOC129924077 n=1 Tax=Biomphalaria glabrata TaxID=6526 RepID=A0A9W2ZFY6_BIOGL|nr:uncharacterized protein LOC129924077 [Biomphalaria glabrata]
MRMWSLERLRMFVMFFSVTVLTCHEIASKRTYGHRKQNDTSNCLQNVSTGKHDLKHMYCQCLSQLKEAEQNLTQSFEEWRLEADALRNQTSQCLMSVAALQGALRTCELGTGLIDGGK